MCGRYATSRDPADLAAEFGIGNVEAYLDEPLPPDYNVAPTKSVYAVLDRAPRGEPEAAPERQLRVVTWGLVPSWAKDRTIGSRLINARMETVAEKPAFKRAFAARRCLLPADGYYEWYQPEDTPDVARTKSGAPRKQPFFIHPRDGRPLAMAGLYELWLDKSKERDDPDAWLWSAVVLTTAAEDDLGRIHDRMPLFVEPERYVAWLDPTPADTTELLGLLVPAAPGRLEAYPVSTDVNKVANNGPHLIEPLPVDAPPADVSAAETVSGQLF
jgi:putative SOS response-associated peptidase YedK